MDSTWLIISVVLGLVNLGLIVALLSRRREGIDFEPLLRETRRVDDSLRQECARQREEAGKTAGALREEVRATLDGFAGRLDNLTNNLGQNFDKVRETVERKLSDLQSRNELKLDQMRQTVDEKLQSTLEQRLGQQFKLVSERLEQVHKGLGEMQVMASSVGDLRRVLTNVKARGTWGEFQLGNLIEQVMAPDQFARNVLPIPGCNERVEYAIRLPGHNSGELPIWLPIDAKFPQEDYQRLVEASERGDANGVAEAGKALEARVRAQAMSIQAKYISPPHTTDFGILFLPSEGLYAEVLRRPGLVDALQHKHRVAIAGPTTLAALLNSLQMGFRTLAIQQRSSEVWKILGAVKTEFGKFGEVISKVKKKLDEASSHIEQTEVRTRAITRQLQDVTALPAASAAQLLPESLGNETEPDMLPLTGIAS